MKFKFNVNTSEKDYLEFNKFLLVRSHYGKNQIASFRVILTIIFLIFLLLNLSNEGLNWEFVKVSAPLIIILMLSQILLKPFLSISVKSTLNGFKKKGKMAYDPSVVLEFYEESFIEIAPQKKTEYNYSLIERISVVDNKYIYLHTNSAAANILPMSCFESEELKNSFLEFVKTKCAIVDLY